uniref:Uncharacterized protein n=1 Tax=viral metagenome TaxID=1070528 RepID=A0A6C0KU04_9ZZZZ
MLSSALLKYACSLNAEGYSKSQNDQQKMTDAIKGCLTLFIIAVLIDLIFVFYALWCLFSSNLPWYLTAFLIICMLYPGLGFMVSVGIIIYYHMVVLKKSQNTTTISNEKNKTILSGETNKFYFY